MLEPAHLADERVMVTWLMQGHVPELVRSPAPSEQDIDVLFAGA